MKKFFSFLAIMAILVVSNCSKIPENNDPILGTWEKNTTFSSESKSNLNVKEEWIFNDVFLGRYHSFENGELTIISDFAWSKEDDHYVITYPGLDREDAEVSLTDSEGNEILEMDDGIIFAMRK